MKTKWLLGFIFVCGLLFGPMLSYTYAIPSDVKILTSDEIKTLSEADLKQAYIDVLIELEAETIFYGRAGFLKRDLDEYRQLIRYRVNLMLELQSRKLEVPRITPQP